MNDSRTYGDLDTAEILLALKEAVIKGDAWQYEELVNAALAAGATDEQIDKVAHDAVQSLLSGAEEPVTSRELAAAWRPSTWQD